MSFDLHIYNSCIKKRKYKTLQNALDALKKIRKTGKIVPPNACAYKCDYCYAWHLGHNKKGI